MLATTAQETWKMQSARKKAGTLNNPSELPRVLIWEDDVATVMQLDKTFTMAGCRTKSVSFGNEAYIEFHANSYDLVVMDYQLSFTDARRALDGVPDWARMTTPFVLISSQDRRDEAQQLGFSAFYQKPVLVDTAADILRRFVGHMPARSAEVSLIETPALPLSFRAHQVCDQL